MKPLIVFDERSERWLKKALRTLVTFSIGAALGALAHKKLTQKPPTPDAWGDTEEAMLVRMQGFQVRLNDLEKACPDNVESLSKQMEAQRGIEDILVKYREAKQAKWTPYVGGAGTALTAMLTGLLGWLAARFGSNIKREGSEQAKTPSRSRSWVKSNRSPTLFL